MSRNLVLAYHLEDFNKFVDDVVKAQELHFVTRKRGEITTQDRSRRQSQWLFIERPEHLRGQTGTIVKTPGFMHKSMEFQTALEWLGAIRSLEERSR